MGAAFASRRNAGVEVVDLGNNNAYRYPPKSGSYFSSHFIMGGERFDMTQPEAYLFGENQDLNFLGNKPIPFPYPLPQGNEPTKTLKSLVNIRKDTIRFVKIPDAEKIPLEDSGTEDSTSITKYNIEFTFDTDVKCAITIYYFAMEEISNGQIVYHPRDATMNSETYHYKRGANQVFSQSTHIVDPSNFPEEDWQYNPDREVIPVVIQCVVEDEEHAGHAHVTFAVVERNSDNGYVLKPLKQKQFVDGLCYLLQEIYGIENKNVERSKLDMDEEMEDTGSECVICMSDMRDTLILPCRHLCLCNNCAESLRYQASNCPICRAPFRALLQIRAMRKKQPVNQGGDNEENLVSQEGVPAGYEAVSLIEALNGPCFTSSVPSPMQVPHEGNREKKKSVKRRQTELINAKQQNVLEETIDKENKTDVKENLATTPEVVMSEQLVNQLNAKEKSSDANQPPGLVSPKGEVTEAKDFDKVSLKSRGSVEVVNETVVVSSTDERTSPVGECVNCEEYLKLYQQVEKEYEKIVESMEDSASDKDLEEPEPDYDDIKDEDLPRLHIQPHAEIIFDKGLDDRPDIDAETLGSPLLNDSSESVSLPGTPSSSAEGSSTGSRGSSQLLLPIAPGLDKKTGEIV